MDLALESPLLRPLRRLTPLFWRRLVLALATVASLWLAVQLGWRIYDAMHWAPPAAEEQEAPVLVQHSVDIAQLIDAHLFGSADAANNESEEVAETSVPLKLVGVYGASEEAKASAIVEAPGGIQSVVFVGEALPAGGGTLKQVFADRIVFDRGGRLETLRMEDDTAQIAAQMQQLPEQGTAAANSATTIDRRNDPYINQQMRNLRAQFQSNPSKLADVIQIQPNYAGAQLQGYRLMPGKDRKLFARFGLQQGDVVQAVNGMALDDPQRAMSMLQELQSATEIQLTLQRSGQSLTVMLPLNQ